MSTNELEMKRRELRQLQNLIEEAPTEAEAIVSRFMGIFMALPPDRQVALYYRLEQEQKEKEASQHG